MINGAKMWISMADYAKVALIFAQTDPSLGHKGLACFLVDTDQPGFRTPADRAQDGPARLRHASIALEDVEVSDEQMLGQVGDGFKVAMSALDSGRYSVAAGCVGICQGCVEESVRYAKERVQFGSPIASFQLVQAMIADMVLKPTPRGCSCGGPAASRTRAPNTLETSVAKLHATEASLECANLAIQVHGGAGYVDDHRRALLPRRPRDHALRGHLAGPETDHRARHDRHQRARRRLSAAWGPRVTPAGRARAPT